jgi:arginine deiminase
MPSYGVSHEGGRLRRVLVHHPGKELELANLNPRIHHFDQPVDANSFRADHRTLMETLTQLGVEVIDVGTIIKDDPDLAEAQLSCPNLVFTRDSSTMTNAGPIVMRMGLPSRRAETPIIEAAYERLDIPSGLRLEEPETFEGGGFALIEGRAAVAGLCSRTTQGALDAIRKFLFERGIIDTFIVLNVPPDDIHIDGDFAELPGKTAIVHRPSLDYSPAVFHARGETWSASFVDWLKDEGWDLLTITDRERLDMAANFLAVDSDVAVHYTGNPRVMGWVRERGIDVIQIPGEEMRKGNGGVHCMTCPIKRV